jgi:hypothetical protein
VVDLVARAGTVVLSIAPIVNLKLVGAVELVDTQEPVVKVLELNFFKLVKMDQVVAAVAVGHLISPGQLEVAAE